MKHFFWKANMFRTALNLAASFAFCACSSSPLDGVPTWRTIPAGTFQMGSPASEKCRDNDENPHKVTLTHSYEIMTTEVVRGNFKSTMGYDPTWFTPCDTCPVCAVNWNEAVAYCNALSSLAGYSLCYKCSGFQNEVECEEHSDYTGSNIYKCKGFRLPTEAEWEYAYRAGTTSAFYSGEITNCSGFDPNADMIGWYKYPSDRGHRKAGLKEPNYWDLYDMAGNVYEWCHDWWKEGLGSYSLTDPWGAKSGDERVRRGGSHSSETENLRAAYRSYQRPRLKLPNVGFRCVRTIK